MAQNSKDKKPTDQLAITYGNDAMQTVSKQLFTVLDSLEKQQEAGLSTENAALTSYLTAESALSIATTKFAGPSPKFDAPTWEGSPANPKRASYKDEFTPIIHGVLTAPTAQSDELAIEAQLLATAIKDKFNTQATERGLVPNGKGIPTDLTDDTAAMQWIADTTITLSGTVPEDVQTAIANAMIQKVHAMTSTTLYNHLQNPDYWRAISDLEVTGGGSAGVIEAAVGAAQTFLSTLWQDQQNTKPLDLSSLEAKIIEGFKTDNFKQALGKLTNDEQNYFKNLITTSATEALKAAKAIDQSTLSGNAKNNIGPIISELTKFSKPNAANTFTNKEVFPASASTVEPSFDGDFWAIIQTALSGSAAAEEGATEAKLNKILGAFQTSYKTLPRNPLDPTAPITDEAEINSWVESTVSNLVSKQTVTMVQSEMLESGLIDCVASLFPIPDKISFYETFQDNLSEALLNLPMPKPRVKSPSSSDDSDDQNKDETSKKEKDQQKKDKPEEASSTSKKLNKGLRYVVNKHVSGPSITDAAEKVIANLKSGHSNPAAEAIVADSNAKDVSDLAKQIKDTLVKDIEGVVEQAIGNVFLALSEQGIQGQMISTAYDYQLINRITSYTNTLLNQLDKHYDQDVPANSTESISAAQAITSASVAFSNYAGDLDTLSEAYGRAGATANSGSDRNTQELDLYFKGNKTSGTMPAWKQSLSSIADAVYSTGTSNEALILTSEFDAVQLAANAAGFSSNLNDEFKQERASADAALASLLTNTQALFNSTQTSYDQLSTDYFQALGDYTEAKEAYKIDEAVVAASASSLAGLTSIMENATATYDAASLATLQSS